MSCYLLKQKHTELKPFRVFFLLRKPTPLTHRFNLLLKVFVYWKDLETKTQQTKKEWNTFVLVPSLKFSYIEKMWYFLEIYDGFTKLVNLLKIWEQVRIWDLFLLYFYVSNIVLVWVSMKVFKLQANDESYFSCLLSMKNASNKGRYMCDVLLFSLIWDVIHFELLKRKLC